MHKAIIPIKGMHCRSCEVLIEQNLKKIQGVGKVYVSYRKGKAEVYSSLPIQETLFESAVKAAGYEIGEDKKPLISRNFADYRDLVIAILILGGLYLIAKKLGLINLNFGGSSNSPSNLLVVLIVGLTAGFSTCMALVGGLVLGISARHAEKHPEAGTLERFRPHLFFNLGRISSYFVLGGLIGLAGKAFQLSGYTLGIMIIAVGLFMFILGLQLTEIFPRVSIAGLTLPTGLAKLIGIKEKHEKEYSHRNSLLVGALTFFLPCGFTQAMQLYAMSTGSFWRGAAIMGIFAIGTAPGLLGIGGLTSVVKGAFAKKFFKFAGVLIIALAIFNISNGLNLTGWKNIFSFQKEEVSAQQPYAPIEEGYQVARMDQTSRGYSPNKFTVVNGVPVKWIINSLDPRSCAASIVARDIGVKQFMKAGENVIEFTPDKVGDIKFSCSMGMYSGKFAVVENNEFAPGAKDTPAPKISASPSSITTPSSVKDAQLIKAIYFAASVGDNSDLKPYEFTVTAGKPVRFEVFAEVDGEGCMSTIAISGINQSPQFLEKGKTIVFEFTPEKKTYYITCAMGAVRGKIVAN